MGRPRDMEGIRSRGIVLFAVGVCLLLATVVVLERDVDEQPVASYTTDMAPHAALTAAATKRAAFKASIKAAFLRAVGKTPPATALHHRQSLFPDSFRVLKLQARQSKYRERNARFHNDKGYGRRLLGASKEEKKDAPKQASHKKEDVLQEFGGSADCKASGGPPKEIAMQPGKWKMIGKHFAGKSWKYIYVQLSQEYGCARAGGRNRLCKSFCHNKNRHERSQLPWETKCKWGNCRGCSQCAAQVKKAGKRCVLLDYRQSKDFQGCQGRGGLRGCHEAKAHDKAIPAPEHSQTRPFDVLQIYWPKVIGKEGQCIAKCRAVTWFMQPHKLIAKHLVTHPHFADKQVC